LNFEFLAGGASTLQVLPKCVSSGRRSFFSESEFFMADVVSVHAATATVHTGKGQLAGIVISASAGAPLVTIYDNTSAAGTKIFEAYVNTAQPLVIFFSDRYGPRFTIGLHLVLAANLVATLWTRQL
jgi:hypothetical protein